MEELVAKAFVMIEDKVDKLDLWLLFLKKGMSTPIVN